MCMLDKIFMITWKVKSSSFQKPDLLTPEQKKLFQELVQNNCFVLSSEPLYNGNDGGERYKIDSQRIDELYRFA